MLLLDMHLSFFNDYRKEVIVTLPVQRLGLLLQTAEELSWCLPSWVIPHMDNFPPSARHCPWQIQSQYVSKCPYLLWRQWFKCLKPQTLSVWLTKPHKGIFFFASFACWLATIVLVVEVFLLILLRYMSENKLKNYRKHSDFLWKIIKL